MREREREREERGVDGFEDRGEGCHHCRARVRERERERGVEGVLKRD